MKKFVVVKFSEETTSFVFRRRVLNADPSYMCYFDVHQQENDYQDYLTERMCVFFVDTEADAKALCEYLSGKFTQNMYLWAESKQIYSREPGPVQISKFTEKGIMPV